MSVQSRRISVVSVLCLLLYWARFTREKCQIGASGVYAARVMDSKNLFECMEGLDVSVACYQTSADFVPAGKTEDPEILQKKPYAIGKMSLSDHHLGFTTHTWTFRPWWIPSFAPGLPMFLPPTTFPDVCPVRSGGVEA